MRNQSEPPKQYDDTQTECVFGRNAVLEALKSGRPADTLFVARKTTATPVESGALGAILALARERGVVIKEADRHKLEQLSDGGNHQSVALLAAAHAYAELDDLFALAESRGEAPFFLICDEIEDPHNLGAMLRTAEAAGAHGVIVPRRRSAPLSQAVAKASAGAVEYIPVARVPNLCAAMEELKERGLWIFGADMGGEAYDAKPLTGAIALVIGSEGKGLGRLVREHCDGLLALPMQGQIASLNASVAAGILLYEVVRSRKPCV
ncbi:MAG: 23S rRNA (guanosine(2251)-2'-O)-methyltransferase RlmB [Oscillospiraceae bacterium]|jgi:23S rRNA (guanosine2251-2'-O)-methyltransferase|nr:23S rRNA (guanosine(2251)-2'-O)-methyltransferase RlmB [Oscillospiraceae bacterium]